MKKIGIVTYQYNNYGTKLQNYALKHALEALGYEPYSIVIKFRKDTFIILAKLIIKSSPKFAFIKNRQFNNFSKKYLSRLRVSYSKLDKLNDDFDYLVAGSDQIWNPNHLGTRQLDRRLFFLDFVDQRKRIAYAPSFGVDILPEGEESTYKSAIKGFVTLSVREPSGANIIKSLTGEIATIVPDPTFLLNKEEWNSLTANHDETYATKNYIAVYYLSNQSNDVLRKIQDYADNNDMEMITISGDLYSNGAIVPDPAEFVAIIKNAKAVFTDSFHACVFSTIHEIPFIVRRRTDVSQFTRVENLLERYNLQDAIDTGQNISEVIGSLNFSESTGEIELEREVGLKYLREALKK